MERLVTLSEAAGWNIDRIEIEGRLSEALASACRTNQDVRKQALAWIDGRIAELGGPVIPVWRERGHKLSRVKELLTLTRIRMLLAAADEASRADCPFWLEPSDHFAGRQISDDRWNLSLGGGGKGILARRGGDTDFQGGGAGRLLIGRTFGSRSSLYLGAEVGGSGGFPRGADGERGNLVLTVDVVTPLVYRHTLVNSYFEVEGGWLGTITEEPDAELEQGIHLGAAFGARASRTRWVFPGGAIGISWERTFPGSGAALYTFKIGFRAAIDFDF